MEESNQQIKPVYSNWAIAALVFVILSMMFMGVGFIVKEAHWCMGIVFITGFLTWVAAGICGLWGYSAVSSSKGAKKGYVFIAVGLTWFVAGVIALGYAIITLPPKSNHVKSACMANMHQLSMGLMWYATENKGQFSSTATWCDDIKEFVGTDYDDCYKCPAIRQGDCHYAINENLLGVSLGRIKKPDEVVMIFESRQSGWNQHGGPELLAYEDHQWKDNRCQYLPEKSKRPIGANIAFCDCHVEFVPVEEYDKLRWRIEDETNQNQ
ncbi:MAG: phage holin family protein [Sedimentisphaerales bacterium]|nr:phage holin family protein [Sedimentisphaerales bacterium]